MSSVKIGSVPANGKEERDKEQRNPISNEVESPEAWRLCWRWSSKLRVAGARRGGCG